MEEQDKPLVWLGGAIKTPPFSSEARIEAGFLLRKLQKGDVLSLPISRPMPSIGKRCHELRITDISRKQWRIVYYLDTDAIVILDVFLKTTQTTPDQTIELCQNRLKTYQELQED